MNFVGGGSFCRYLRTNAAVDDMGEITKATDGDDCATNIIHPSYSWVRNVKMVGVMNQDKHICCINCYTKLVPYAEEPDFGHCSKCQMIQCLDSDSGSNGLMAKLMLVSGPHKYMLCAFTKVIENKPADILQNSQPFQMNRVCRGNPKICNYFQLLLN